MKRKIIQRKIDIPITPTRVYPIDVNTIGIIISTTQPQNNFTYSISNNIYDNLYFQSYMKIYQEYKIIYTQIHITPVIRGGDQPPTMYAMVLANELLTVQYSEIPSLPGTTKIYGKGVTQMMFRAKGRTDDLNRWYNTRDNKPDFSIKFRAISSIGTTEDSPHYTINVRSRILFRRPIIEELNREIEEVQEISGVMTRSGQGSGRETHLKSEDN